MIEQEDKGFLSDFSKHNVTYGNFWERLGAAVIDALIIGIPFGICNVIFRERMTFDTQFMIIYQVIQLIAHLLYFTLQESSASMATLGKKALRLKVVTQDEIERLTFTQAFTRYFIRTIVGTITSIILLIYPLDPYEIQYNPAIVVLWMLPMFIYVIVLMIMIAADPKRQGLHDKGAKTVVIKG